MNNAENIIIAEFIGMQKTELGWFDAEEVLSLPNNKDNTFDEFMFDKDWNWLISVIEVLNVTELENDEATNYFKNIQTKLSDFDIKDVYSACLKMINFINNL